VNVFNLLNNFFREDAREKVSSSATKLYFFLIYEANKSYWEGPLMLSVRRLSSFLSFSKNTVSKSLSELEDRGLIICYPHKEDSLTADVEGKGASSSAFWFADLQLRETSSQQARITASQQVKKEKKEVWDKGESKYAKFF
jgi:DNA-binding transcriptional regulator YhcF (GntR family)